jgi:RNA polymerase sigma-70 factor
MASDLISFSNDLTLAEACLARTGRACEDFEEKYQTLVRRVLSARGATPLEAEDLVRNLLSDCVMGQPGSGRALLPYYNGKCTLKSWLSTCATRRFIDLRRRGAKKGSLPGAREDDTRDPFDAVPAPECSQLEPDLIALLRRSLEHALAACPVETRLMLRLVYMEGLTQREIARMWQFHESRVSRKLDQAMQGIKMGTMAKVKELDPFLSLEWNDFLEMCQSSLTGLPL